MSKAKGKFTEAKNPFYIECFTKLYQYIKGRLLIFCTYTLTHNCRFFPDITFSKYEKAFWFVAVSLCSAAAGSLSWYSLFLSEDNPTVTIVESTHYPTYKIPFPAVTICNVNKFSKKAMVAFAKELKNPSPNATFEDNLAILKLLSGYMDLNTFYGNNFEDLDNLLSFNKLTIEKILPRLFPSCTEMIEKCFWLGTEVRCEAYFEKTTTFLGACCSFNYFGAKKQTNVTTRRDTTQILQQTKIVTTSGPLAGLIVVLNPLIDDYFYTKVRMRGFRVIVHDSFDYPQLNSPNAFIEGDTVSFLGVMPESTYSKDEIYGKDIMMRECYADTEIKLNVMKQYSFINCMVECRRLIAFNWCKCVPFHYPRNGSLPTCNATQQRCIMKYSPIISKANPIVNQSVGLMPELPIASSCHCLPSCKYYQYTFDMMHGKLKYNESLRTQYYLRGFKRANQSILHVYYTDIVTTVYRRDMFLNWMGVLAMFGGLTGLFMGLSLIGIFEFLYIFTVRNLFDWLANRSSKIFVQALEKRHSEISTRPSKITFKIQKF